MDIKVGDLDDPAVRDLLELHLDGMHSASPPGTVMALDLDGLKGPNVSFWTIWSDGALAGCGALNRLSAEWGELKSMRTHPDHLRKGAGRAILIHILDVARQTGLQRISLETGSGPAFEPAIQLYASHGFKDGGPFAHYPKNGFSRFFHLDL